MSPAAPPARGSASGPGSTDAKTTVTRGSARLRAVCGGSCCGGEPTALGTPLLAEPPEATPAGSS